MALNSMYANLYFAFAIHIHNKVSYMIHHTDHCTSLYLRLCRFFVLGGVVEFLVDYFAPLWLWKPLLFEMYKPYGLIS